MHNRSRVRIRPAPPRVTSRVWKPGSTESPKKAITNAVKHAQATRLILTVNEGAETVALSVEDNGCGFEAADRSNGGFGLIGMRERVELLGKLEVMSRAGGGTRVDVAVPVQRRNADPTGESAPERAAG